ncbi:MAG: hypothetical protein Q9221_002406 [Calogaya cf. arnoldii]
MPTKFTCYDEAPPKSLPKVLPPGTSSRKPPRTLPHDCRDCMAYSAGNQEAATRGQYLAEIEAVRGRIAHLGRNADPGIKLQLETRVDELRDEMKEMSDCYWANYEKIWGARPVGRPSAIAQRVYC